MDGSWPGILVSGDLILFDGSSRTLYEPIALQRNYIYIYLCVYVYVDTIS